MSRFCFHYKKDKIDLEVKVLRGKVSQCRLNGCDFRGACPVTQCHANIPVNDAHCLYLYYPKKDEFDKYDLMLALNLNEKKFRDRYNNGKSAIHSTLLLNNIMTRLKTNDKLRRCPFCGVGRSTPGPCFNKVECFKRNEFVADFVSKSRLGLKEFKTQPKDVWLLLANKDKVEEFLNASNAETTSASLLDLSDEYWEETNLVRTFI